MSYETLICCPCCGLMQRLPAVDASSRACCARCETVLSAASHRRAANRWTVAFSLAALILYPLAITLPMLHVEKLGNTREASIITGTIGLLASGQYLVGSVVLLCSIVFPLGKLSSLLFLCAVGRRLHSRHRALTYHFVEWTGRWGMLDVLLVALLVAVLKLRDLVQVSPGPAATAFAACVLLSLLAAATFDSRLLWEPAAGAEVDSRR